LATIEHDDLIMKTLARHFDFGAAHDYRGGLHRSASDERPTDRAKGRPSGFFYIALLLGDDSDAFLGPISQTDKRTRRLCSFPDRVADLSRACTAPGLSDNAGAEPVRDLADHQALFWP
jgi:hypothetical protein